jgi:hypothetical protein
VIGDPADDGAPIEVPLRCFSGSDGGALRSPNQGSDPKSIGDHERGYAAQIALWRRHWNGKPVVPINQGEFHHQEFGQVYMLCIQLTEIGDAVFEGPPSRIVDAAEGHMIGQKVEIERRDLRWIGSGERILIASLKRERICDTAIS